MGIFSSHAKEIRLLLPRPYFALIDFQYFWFQLNNWIFLSHTSIWLTYVGLPWNRLCLVITSSRSKEKCVVLLIIHLNKVKILHFSIVIFDPMATAQLLITYFWLFWVLRNFWCKMPISFQFEMVCQPRWVKKGLKRSVDLD